MSVTPFFRVSAALLMLLCMNAASFAAIPSLDDDDDLDAVFPTVADPLEAWNRAVFSFNDFVFEYGARPAAKGYAAVVPQCVRAGLKNVFHNLGFPARFVNNLLQGKGMAAGVEMSRFVLNTTAGLGGFFDVAQDKKSIVPVDDDEDLGQTFGVWGIGEGPYIVWPLLGPGTLRDSIGRGGDFFLSPLTYVRPFEVGIGISSVRIFNELDEILDLYDSLKRSAVEPYSAVRDAYVQYRRAKIDK
ncbi:MAG: VacJ family lipoprotein [Desulfovibrio sp.]|jgi:phospholipid-binding lipoprotein MlaA|nr:VacJ family lipoprotein [Desulfovibrio sp.]